MVLFVIASRETHCILKVCFSISGRLLDLYTESSLVELVYNVSCYHYYNLLSDLNT